ncbi:MAG: Hsp20/alpha crystallin family protein [Acholeplasmataceae bacterium]
MLSLIRRNQDLLSNFFDDVTDYNVFSKNSLMKTDIKELEDSFELLVELPGFKKEDVRVSVDNKYLNIEANREYLKEEDKDTKFIRRERYYGTIKRSFYVSNITIDEIKGEFKDGILTLTVPKESKNIPEKKYLSL